MRRFASEDERKLQKETCIEKLARYLAILLIIIFPFLLVICFRVVKQYKRAIIFRFGRVRKNSPAGPGVIWLVPCTDSAIIVDLRTQSYNLPSQDILTKDSVTVTVDAVIYFHVAKPLESVLNVENFGDATELIAISTLRNILGQYILTDLLSCRESISHSARSAIEEVVSEWGVKIERVQIKDVLLPFDLQKAMAAEAEGTRIGKAKVIEAQGEIKAAENLKIASRIMVEKPQIMILRYLQTLSYIAAQQDTSIFFPFPFEIPEIGPM